MAKQCLSRGEHQPLNQIYPWIGKRWWTMQRFGVTPNKIANRIINRTEPKIFCVSIPKAGTHLIERVLCLHPKLYRAIIPTLNPSNLARFGGLQKIVSGSRSGQVLMTHLYYSAANADIIIIKKYGFKCLLMVRDPRDIIISTIFYVDRNEKHHLYKALSKRKNLKEKMQLWINGSDIDHIPPYNQYLNRFTGWFDEECLVVRFEELVKKVNVDNSPFHTVKSIYSYLGMYIELEQAQKISKEMVSANSPTFRRGKSEQWKEFFDDETKQLFKTGVGNILIKMGYESDYDW